MGTGSILGLKNPKSCLLDFWMGCSSGALRTCGGVVFVWSEDPELDSSVDMNTQRAVVLRKGRQEV